MDLHLFLSFLFHSPSPRWRCRSSVTFSLSPSFDPSNPPVSIRSKRNDIPFRPNETPYRTRTDRPTLLEDAHQRTTSPWIPRPILCGSCPLSSDVARVFPSPQRNRITRRARPRRRRFRFGCVGWPSARVWCGRTPSTYRTHRRCSTSHLAGVRVSPPSFLIDLRRLLPLWNESRDDGGEEPVVLARGRSVSQLARSNGRERRRWWMHTWTWTCERDARASCREQPRQGRCVLQPMDEGK